MWSPSARSFHHLQGMTVAKLLPTQVVVGMAGYGQMGFRWGWGQGYKWTGLALKWMMVGRVLLMELQASVAGGFFPS